MNGWSRADKPVYLTCRWILQGGIRIAISRSNRIYFNMSNHHTGNLLLAEDGKVSIESKTEENKTSVHQAYTNILKTPFAYECRQYP